MRYNETKRRQAVVYARSSLVDKIDDIVNQSQVNQDYADEHNLQIIEEYVDFGSAKERIRPAYTRMQEYIKNNSNTVVIVISLDKLFRKRADFIELNEMVDNNRAEIHVVSSNEIISHESPQSARWVSLVSELKLKKPKHLRRSKI